MISLLLMVTVSAPLLLFPYLNEPELPRTKNPGFDVITSFLSADISWLISQSSFETHDLVHGHHLYPIPFLREQVRFLLHQAAELPD